jgi:DNA polymerase-4
MAGARTILHADLDAFFASAEQLDDASLRGRPVLVGGRSPRSVVAAASYEARAFGCRSAMPMARALALCPHAHVARPRFERYSELSGRFMEILGRCSPLVEPLSVDEAFVDCTGSERLLGPGREIAGMVRRAVRDELGLTVSVGIGPNKFVAKLASDMRKPDGMAEAPVDEPPGTLAAWLAPLPIERMWGVGPRSVGAFRAAGVHAFADLQRLGDDEVRRRLGDHAVAMRARALGIDDRQVEPEHEAKGFGHETTFDEDVADPESVEDVLRGLVESAAMRLRAAGATSRTVTVKIRYGDFETVTRSRTLGSATDATLVLARTAREAFRGWCAQGFRPVRLVGVRLARDDGAGAAESSLFADPMAERQRAVDRVADAVARRFGKDAIARGRVADHPGDQPRAGGQQSPPQSSA